MSDIENPFLDPPKKSPGEKEVEAGGFFLELSRALGVKMPKADDPKHFERVGELYMRWWRSITLRKPLA